MDDLSLLKTLDLLGQGVVVAVANAPDPGLDPGLGKAIGRYSGCRGLCG